MPHHPVGMTRPEPARAGRPMVISKAQFRTFPSGEQRSLLAPTRTIRIQTVRSGRDDQTRAREGWSSDGYFKEQNLGSFYRASSVACSPLPNIEFFNPTASIAVFGGLILMHPVLYPRRRNLDHSTPWGVEYPEYFLTLCSRKMGINHLCQPGVGEMVLGLIRKYQETRRWHCAIALLMPDHLHAIVQIPQNLTLVSVVRSFKQACTKQTGVLWQRGFFEHRLRGNDSAEQKYRYIEMNPVRAGLVKRAEDWPWRIQYNDRGNKILISNSDLR